MTPEERIEQLEQEKSVLQEQLAQRDALIAQLLQRVQVLEERQAKDSHNSHLPPSSDRFVRQPKSLRQKSGKQSGGQVGHEGQSLRFSTMPDEVIVQTVDRCQYCQAALDQVAASIGERRQVVDLPAPRVIVREYQSEHKHCPWCQQISMAPSPSRARPSPIRPHHWSNRGLPGTAALRASGARLRDPAGPLGGLDE